MGNQIEGAYSPGQKVVIIEDLISTGGSSLAAHQALKKEDLNPLGMVAIFSYGFDIASKNFTSADCELHTLSNYNSLLDLAVQAGYIHERDLSMLNEWRKDPASWAGK